MSNKPAQEAVLRHWRGPYFPATLQGLHDDYAAWVHRFGALNSSVLVHAANRIPTFRHPSTIKTEDGYLWARGATFKILRGPLHAGLGLILFPHCTDKLLEDGTMTDRSIALYASTDAVDISELAELVSTFHRSFTETIRSIAA